MKQLLLLLILLWPASVLATPTTPVNAPRAHPLAPNPHTSIGLFWIYTDAGTGRQWTGGTYKVRRCTGAACTPTTIVATGLTSADFQDTGLSANTTYGYRYLANDGADSGDSPTVYVTTSSSNGSAVTFPNATYDLILGPLTETSQIPFAYYNSTATSIAQTIISKLPVVAPSTLQGTAATTSGSKILTGTGTHFREQAAANNPTCLDAIMVNSVNMGAIDTIDSDTQITLLTNAPSSQSGVVSTNVPGLCGFNDPLSDYLIGNQLLYYDSPLAMWKLYFRTGDPQYLRGAIQASEAVFAGYMWLGRNRAWNGFSTTENLDNMPAPRNFQFTGYLLLGMAGHNGIWDSLDKYVEGRYFFLSSYRGGDHNFLFLREKAYTLMDTAQIVIALPDSFPRSSGTVTSLNGGTTVDGDLTDGRKDFWRNQLDTDVPGFILDDQSASGEWREANAYGDWAEGDNPYPPGMEQPWLSGLIGEALGYCWRSTALSSTARDAARKEVLRLAAVLGTRGYNTNIAADDTGFRWRVGWYLLGGGTRLNPYAFEYGADSAILNNLPDSNMIAQYRQLLPLTLETLGLAYEMSGKSIYLTWGDEMANAAFAEVGENTGGTGDGKKALCDNTGNFKDYGQCFRSSPNYFAQRLLSPSSLGTAPSVTMPANVTLTGSTNQASLTASVVCTNTPCTYKWYLVEYPLVLQRSTPMPLFSADESLSTTLSGLEKGAYKAGFYALDSLGLVGQGTVNITVGDGVFPPVVAIHKDGTYYGVGTICTTGTSVSNITVRAYSAAGRTLTHSFSGTGPKDQSAPTITPSGTTGNLITLTMSGLSAGWWILKDVVTDSAGTARTAYLTLAVHPTSCGSLFTQPSGAHNTIPQVAKPPDHVLLAGATSTRLYVTPIDPEGITGFASSAAGYTTGYNGSVFLVTALTHAWSQTAGPMSATITSNANRADITTMNAPGTYTFRYTGTDQQGDAVSTSVNVTVLASSISGSGVCRWSTTPPCQ